MKKITIISFFISCFLFSHGQKNPKIFYSYPDRSLSSQTPLIPFDREFMLAVLKFPNIKVRNVYVYEVHFVKGERILHRMLGTTDLIIDSASLVKAAKKILSAHQQTALNDYLDKHKGDFDSHYLPLIKAHPVTIHKLKKLIREDVRNYVSINDFEATFIMSGDTLLINFPPIRPGKYFDIEVNTALDNTNQILVFELNKAVVHQDSGVWQKKYDRLVDQTKEIDYNTSMVPNNINIGTMANYRFLIFDTLRWDSLYHTMADTRPDLTPLPDTAGLFRMERNLIQHKIKYPNVFTAVKINLDQTRQAVLYGLLPANYRVSTALADTFDFPARTANLDVSQSYFDSLALAMDQNITKSGSDKSSLHLLDTIKGFDISISDREKMMKSGYNALVKNINEDTLLQQSYMFGSDNQPADLKTKSVFCLTTDLGFTNIFARDYNNKVNYIPKLFFGVNFYFRQVDKNADLSALQYRFCERGLRSSRNPWQNISFSLGLTLGSMTNPNFSNLYNSFSLTAGPSYRFAKVLRLTAGAAFLQRTQANPELTTKQFIVGAFVAFSVDIDFLTPIKNVTDLVFK